MTSVSPDLAIRTQGTKSIDANRYATKKTIAQGMLDIALLTANASQLKYVLQVGEKHEFYHLMLSLISISIILQVVIGVLYVVIGGLNINKDKNSRAANILNDVLLFLVFVVSVINVLISAFGIEHTDEVTQGVLRSTSGQGQAAGGGGEVENEPSQQLTAAGNVRFPESE